MAASREAFERWHIDGAARRRVRELEGLSLEVLQGRVAELIDAGWSRWLAENPGFDVDFDTDGAVPFRVPQARVCCDVLRVMESR